MALIEPGAFGDVPVATATAFPCPSCQQEAQAWIMHGPRAHRVDDVLWSCVVCGTSTRWALIRRVLESAPALERFFGYAGIAA